MTSGGAAQSSAENDVGHSRGYYGEISLFSDLLPPASPPAKPKLMPE